MEQFFNNILKNWVTRSLSIKIQSDAFTLSAVFSAAVIGMSVYLIDRQPDSVYLIPSWISLTDYLDPIFGIIGNHLPTFIHVYVFILLTVMVMRPSTMKVYAICIAWLTVDSLFELAQHETIAQWISGHVPGWFEGIPILENMAVYFLGGTFDIFDLISITLGTLAAYLTIKYIRSREN